MRLLRQTVWHGKTDASIDASCLVMSAIAQTVDDGAQLVVEARKSGEVVACV
jgi:hypothetical protein